MDINIRLAVPSDASDMAEIHARSWEAAYKDMLPMEFIKEKNATRNELWHRIITDENKIYYIIQANGKTAGLMAVAPPLDDDADDSVYELRAIYLNPDYFRRGIGSKAMDFAFHKARELGKTTMTVWTFAENLNTIKFYEKCGFVADGSTKTLEYGKIMDCVRMRRDGL